ncbi:MAG: hypothetical protein Q9215_000104 [Flavoplaca cf. flavocitrina]
MYRSQHKTLTLPRSLNDEIGIKGTHIPQLGDDHLLTEAVEISISAKRKRQTGPGIRKERRKAARTEKKLQKPHQRPESIKKRDSISTPGFQPKIIKQDHLEPVDHLPSSRNSIQYTSQKSILKPSGKNRLPKDDESSSPPPDSSNKSISRVVKERLAADDAEIAALEKALGVKDKEKLLKYFEEDGLDSLLNGLGDELSSIRTPSKRKRDEGEEWLDMKRKKACKLYRQAIPDDPSDMSEDPAMDSSFEGLSDLEIEDEDQDGGIGDLSTDSESNDDSMSQDSTGPSSDCAPTKNAIRENPYRAPVTAEVAAPKYTPPSLRNQHPSESEDLSRLRRKVQGLINRLSEANLISILGDIESLYQSNPRHYVSSTLLDILLGMLSDSASLQDTFIILHAGFITAVYKMIGPDFGAQIIKTIDEEFRLDVDAREDDASSGKKLTNLASLLSSLYTFQLIGSKLIYDYIKMFIEDLSEGKVELLLKILRNSGPQLRQDDPSALKEIVLQLQRAVGEIGEENLSVRTKFMIETINNLKNNRMKTGIAASMTMSEHVIRMKKTLGSLNTRRVRASEPLRIGVSDIRESDKRGKWWLIGASYKDQVNDVQDNLPPREKTRSQDATELGPVPGTADDLLQMARAQGMNTSVRQSIFKTIMSASDYNNAFQLLMTLALRKSQEPEIAKVIVHCAGVEQAYNPYYSLLSRRLCAARGKYKMAFQFSLWGIFKRLGDGPDDDPTEAEEDSGTLSMRTIVNVAKMFGALVAEGGLSLNILKVLNFPYLQPKTSIFVELMIITIILQTQKGVGDSSDESRLTEIFVQANGNAGLAQGLQRFLKKTVSRTDVAGTKADSETLRWGCKVARNALDAVVSANTIE